jgi:hypothetical protein
MRHPPADGDVFADHDDYMHQLEVEVFPVEPDRWIVVVDAPQGPFSTEAARPDQVEQEARDTIAEVLGWTDVQINFVDDVGDPWSPAWAPAQVSRLLDP